MRGLVVGQNSTRDTPSPGLCEGGVCWSRLGRAPRDTKLGVQCYSAKWPPQNLCLCAAYIVLNMELRSPWDCQSNFEKNLETGNKEEPGSQSKKLGIGKELQPHLQHWRAKSLIDFAVEI